MKYNTVQIKQKLDKSWETFITIDDQDRKENANASPNLLGFYHFPITESNRKAFGKLKRAILKDIEKQLDMMQQAYNEVSMLKCPKTK